MFKKEKLSLLKDKIVKTIVITNNFNTNIHCLNFRDFGKRVLYIVTG